MLRESVVLCKRSGLHLRAAGNFSKACLKYNCAINFEYNSNLYSGKSVLNVLSASVKRGDEIILIFDGEDEELAKTGVLAAINADLAY